MITTVRTAVVGNDSMPFDQSEWRTQQHCDININMFLGRTLTKSSREENSTSAFVLKENE